MMQKDKKSTSRSWRLRTRATKFRWQRADLRDGKEMGTEEESLNRRHCVPRQASQYLATKKGLRRFRHTSWITYEGPWIEKISCMVVGQIGCVGIMFVLVVRAT